MIDNKVLTNTLVDPNRLRNLEQLLLSIQNIEGNAAEVGVYWGGTGRLICQNANSKVFLIDTFSGLPAEHEKDNYCKKGMFNETSIERVLRTLESCENFTIMVQEFPKGDTSKLDNLKFKIVHIDVDIYESTKNCLEYFYPRMVPGGVIVIDDYNEKNCAGCKTAVDEFMHLKPDYLHTSSALIHAWIIKV